VRAKAEAISAGCIAVEDPAMGMGVLLRSRVVRELEKIVIADVP